MDLVRCSELLQASIAQDGDPVRQLQRLILVMGDEDRGLARALVDIAQPASEVFSHLGVKRAERLARLLDHVRRSPRTSSRTFAVHRLRWSEQVAVIAQALPICFVRSNV